MSTGEVEFNQFEYQKPKKQQNSPFNFDALNDLSVFSLPAQQQIQVEEHPTSASMIRLRLQLNTEGWQSITVGTL